MGPTGIAAILGSCAVLLVAMFVMPGRSVAQLAVLLAAFAVCAFGVHGWVLPKHYARRGKKGQISLAVSQFGWQDWARFGLVAAGFFGLVLLGVAIGAA